MKSQSSLVMHIGGLIRRVLPEQTTPLPRSTPEVLRASRTPPRTAGRAGVPSYSWSVTNSTTEHQSALPAHIAHDLRVPAAGGRSEPLLEQVPADVLRFAAGCSSSRMTSRVARPWAHRHRVATEGVEVQPVLRSSRRRSRPRGHHAGERGAVADPLGRGHDVGRHCRGSGIPRSDLARSAESGLDLVGDAQPAEWANACARRRALERNPGGISTASARRPGSARR